MFLTSAECRTLAEEKLAEADRDNRHRKRLITAAEGWLFLASKLRRLEKSLGYDEAKK
jgi:hypothetical protein